MAATKPRVCVIYTGGTIGMMRETPAHPLKPGSLAQMIDHVPAIRDLGIDLTPVSLDPPLDSSNVNVDHWLQIAETVDAHYDHDGFVILHGTDTMAYTASALSFLFENLDKPVVVTGSQLPMSDPRTDARGNLANSLMIAGYGATKLPRIPEVVLVFASKVLRGCRATKVSSKRWEGFDSPNCPVLGVIGEHITIYRNRLRKAPAGDQPPAFYVNRDICREVAIQPVYPGLTPEQLERTYCGVGIQGLVLETFGAGNAPSNDDFVNTVARLRNDGSGMAIYNVTQCVDGDVEMGLYDASAALLDVMLSGSDMTREAASAKLMILLPKCPTEEDRRRVLQRSERGEQSQSIDEVRFSQPDDASSAGVMQLGPKHVSSFDPRMLNHASVRLSDIVVTLDEDAAAEEMELRCFLNLRSASSSTSIDDPHHATTFKIGPQHEGYLIAEITNAAFNVIGRSGDVSVTLVAVGGTLRFKECVLTLFRREPV